MRILRDLIGASVHRRAVMTLFSGSAVGAGITYVAQIILTRLYTPADFGVADLFAAVIAVVLPVASLRYEDALILPEDDSDAAHLFWMAAGLSLLAAGLLSAAVFLRPWIDSMPAYRSLGPWLIWMGPALLVLRIGKLSEAWLTRIKTFTPLAVGHVGRSGVTGFWRIVAGLGPGSSPAGLINGYIAGAVATAAVHGAPLVQNPGALRRRTRWLRMKRLARRYRRFAQLTTPSTLFHSLSSRLPFLLLAAFFSEEIVGLFGRAFLVLAVPLGVIGGAVARVFVANAAEARREGTLEPLALAFHRRLVHIGLYPALAVVLFGPSLFEVVFGAPWREAGVYASYTAPWLFLASTSATLSVLFDVTERHVRDLATSIMMLAGLTMALVVGGFTGSPGVTMLFLGVTGALLRAIHLHTILGAAGARPGSWLTEYGKTTLIAIPALLIPGAASLLSRPLLTFAGVVAGFGVYGILLLRQEKRPAS